MSSVLLGLFTFIPTLATVTVAILNNFVLSPDFARQIINVMTPKIEHDGPTIPAQKLTRLFTVCRRFDFWT